MPVTGIDQVHFWAKDGEEAAQYLKNWGLIHVADDCGERYECADGSAVSFAVASAATIDQSMFKNLQRVTWGVSEQDELNQLVNDLSRDRDVRIDAHGEATFVDDIGLTLGLRVTRRRPLVANPILYNTPGAPTRIDQTAVHYEEAIPQEISHIVLGVADLAAGEAFYRQRLGFHLSDRYVNRGVFLRAPPIGTHHNLFMLDDGHADFNHLAFKVRDIHEVIGGGQAFVRAGAETLTGPGRHYASSGCFWYFKSPFGGAMEYVADEDIVTPAWQPSELIPSPERFSEWVFHSKNELGALKRKS